MEYSLGYRSLTLNPNVKPNPKPASRREISIFNPQVPAQPITGDCQHPIAGGCNASYWQPRQYVVSNPIIDNLLMAKILLNDNFSHASACTSMQSTIFIYHFCPCVCPSHCDIVSECILTVLTVCRQFFLT